MQLLRKSYSELKLLETVSSSRSEGRLQNDNCSEASHQVAAEGQQELIERVLKNVAVASEVLQTLFMSGVDRFNRSALDKCKSFSVTKD